MLAVLDANVLYPFQLRNLLLHLAALDAFQPLWSDQLIDEARRNLLSKNVMTEERWNTLEAALREHFGDAWGHGFERITETLKLPDPNDRHVLALALHYEADVIVTHNVSDFPAAGLEPLGVRHATPHTFLAELWDEDSELVLQAAKLHRESLTKSALTPAAYLSELEERVGLRDLADKLRRSGFNDC